MVAQAEVKRLTVLYDSKCGLCQRARAWLESRPAFVPLEFVAAASPAARERYPHLDVSATLAVLHVVADDGRVWSGANAWVMCLWALRETRSLSLRFSGPLSIALAQTIVASLSERRYTLSQIMRWETPKAPTGA